MTKNCQKINWQSRKTRLISFYRIKGISTECPFKMSILGMGSKKFCLDFCKSVRRIEMVEKDDIVGHYDKNTIFFGPWRRPYLRSSSRSFSTSRSMNLKNQKIPSQKWKELTLMWLLITEYFDAPECISIILPRAPKPIVRLDISSSKILIKNLSKLKIAFIYICGIVVHPLLTVGI